MLPPATPPCPPLRSDLPRARQLVSALWLAHLVEGSEVPAAPGAGWRLFEVDEGPMERFVQAHIPTAAYIDTNWLEQPPLWNAIPIHALQQWMLRLGITPDSTVVLYSRTTSAAARVAHLMMTGGVGDVRLLDGGFAAWIAQSLPLASGPPSPPAQKIDVSTGFLSKPYYLVHTPQVRAMLADPVANLVSIRTWEEYVGNTSGYSYIEARGEIPGARWGHAGEDADMNSVSAFQNPDGTMRTAYEILAFWRAAGIHAGRPTVFYCGTGWRASAAFFFAWLMGWDQISVYDGGWFEWSSDPSNPIVVHADRPALELVRSTG